MAAGFSLLEKMRLDWDKRAAEDARYYIANGRRDWSDEEFFASGRDTVSHYILTDMINICQGKSPRNMRVLDLGCGIGRVTRALAEVFGEVYGVDVSGEMIEKGKSALAGVTNVHLFQNNGKDLSVLGDVVFDFAFSTAVFHHIPSREIIEDNIRDVGRHLHPDCLFKFEVQGCVTMKPSEMDTWLGAPMSDEDMMAIADRCKFESRYHVGAGKERFWLWFFKKP
jgi:SAM-dependent methyltransferase